MTLADRIAERKYWARRSQERLVRGIVWKLPRSVVMWSTVRVIAAATTGRYATQVVPDLTAMDALRRWDESAA